MPRNQADRKRINKEKHEIDYCRKIARNVLKKTEHISGYNMVYLTNMKGYRIFVELSSLKRLAKAFLKLLQYILLLKTQNRCLIVENINLRRRIMDHNKLQEAKRR